jgi:hypothetical protein
LRPLVQDIAVSEELRFDYGDKNCLELFHWGSLTSKTFQCICVAFHSAFCMHSICHSVIDTRSLFYTIQLLILVHFFIWEDPGQSWITILQPWIDTIGVKHKLIINSIIQEWLNSELFETLLLLFTPHSFFETDYMSANQNDLYIGQMQFWISIWIWIQICIHTSH